MKIEQIRRMCASGSIRWTNHIMVRLLQRCIGMDDIRAVLLNGEIIEQYPDDYPYPSCLVLGITDQQGALHVVCGTDGEVLWLITAYAPATHEWEHDYKTRKRSYKK